MTIHDPMGDYNRSAAGMGGALALRGRYRDRLVAFQTKMAKPGVRLVWLASALLTLAAVVLWFQNAALLIEQGSPLKRVMVPVLTGGQVILLILQRDQLISGVRRPKDAPPGLLLCNSVVLLLLLMSELETLRMH